MLGTDTRSAREPRVRELEAAHLLQAVEASGLTGRLPAQGGQRPLGELSRGETGVCGPFCGFVLRARAGYRLLLSLERTACTSRTAVRGPWRAPGEARLFPAVMMVI